jgi:hypothetical protein
MGQLLHGRMWKWGWGGNKCVDPARPEPGSNEAVAHIGIWIGLQAYCIFYP